MRRLVRAPALLVVGFMLLQAAWILTMPPFRGIDEFDHAYRAAAVAGGQWVASEPAEDGRGQLVVVPKSIVDAARAQCEALDYTGPDNCSPVRSLPNGRVEIASAASTYHPAFYWVVGTAALPFDGAAALYAMRVATALLSLLFIAIAGWAVAKLPSRWPMTGFVIAVTPVFVYSTTVAAPNGVEMGAGLALWCTLLSLVVRRDRSAETRLLWLAILSAVVLGTLRVLGPVFILMIVATIVALDWGGARELVKRHVRSVLAGCALVAASVAGQAFWAFDSVAGEVTSETADNPTTFNAVNLMVWPLQTIAAFPLRNQAGATIVYPVVLLLVGAMVVLALRRGTSRVRTVTLASLMVTLVFPFVFTFATLNSVGNIWQGRYLLPYGVGFLILAGYAIGDHHAGSGPPSRILVPAALLYGFAVASCLVKVRNDELASNLASVRDTAWHEPSPLVIGVIVGVAVACFVGALLPRYMAQQQDLSAPREVGA